MSKYTTIIIDDTDITIELTRHLLERLDEYNLTEYEVYALILKIGSNLLNLHNNENFAIVDKECGIGIVCRMVVEYPITKIETITAISNDKIWISRGTRVLNISECLENN